MNIQHFSSLADILIDTESLTQSNYDDRVGPLSMQSSQSSPQQDKYDEESFEKESHVLSTTSVNYLQNYDHNDDEGDEQLYENTFEETGVKEESLMHLLHIDDYDDNDDHSDENYENTFENEYSKSGIGDLNPPPSSTVTHLPGQKVTSPTERKRFDVLGTMSGIKATENIRTFEDLALMMSSSNSSNSNSPRVDSTPRIQTPVYEEEPPHNKIHVRKPQQSQQQKESTMKYPLPLEPQMISRPHDQVLSTTPKLFSKVQMLSKEEIQTIQQKSKSNKSSLPLPIPIPPPPPSPHLQPTNSLSYESKKSQLDFSNDDLKTMRKAKAILERIEAQEKFLQDQQTHKMAARKSLHVQNLDLGRVLNSTLVDDRREGESMELNISAGSDQEISHLDSSKSSSSSRSTRQPHHHHHQQQQQQQQCHSIIGLDDDDGVYPAFEENDELSLDSILSGVEDGKGNKQPQRSIPPQVGKTLSQRSRERQPPTHHNQSHTQSHKQPTQQTSKQLVEEDNEELQQHLEELAEQTYFNFLSDLINSSRTRSLTASIEELRMARVLSERLYSFFTQPNQIKLLRYEMIQAGKEIQREGLGGGVGGGGVGRGVGTSSPTDNSIKNRRKK